LDPSRLPFDNASKDFDRQSMILYCDKIILAADAEEASEYRYLTEDLELPNPPPPPLEYIYIEPIVINMKMVSMIGTMDFTYDENTRVKLALIHIENQQILINANYEHIEQLFVQANSAGQVARIDDKPIS
jgi:hypothetical protein